MNSDGGFAVILVLNILWFGAAFLYFSLAPRIAARLLVAKSARAPPLFPAVAACIHFLGGMNLAFAAFAVLVLFNSSLFPEPPQKALFAAAFSLAVANLPAALREGNADESLWPVLSGPMCFIFLMDGALMVANAAIAVILLSR